MSGSAAEQFNPYAAPGSSGSLSAGVPAAAGGPLWRDGRLLVMHTTGTLPDVCVVCNAPAHGATLRRKLYWHSPWWYLMLLVNVLLYIVVALIVRRQADVHVGLCAAHGRRRRRWIAAAWSLFAGAVALPGLLLAFAEDYTLVGVAIMVPMLLIAAIVGIVGGRVVTARRIQQPFVWIAGVTPKLLAPLPAWPGLPS
jgi:hypothetical protein